MAHFEKLIEATFVTHLPKELVPLAKSRSAGPEDPTTVEVFECCINGQEIAPAYTGQNDASISLNPIFSKADWRMGNSSH